MVYNFLFSTFIWLYYYFTDMPVIVLYQFYSHRPAIHSCQFTGIICRQKAARKCRPRAAHLGTVRSNIEPVAADETWSIRRWIDGKARWPCSFLSDVLFIL